MNSKPGGRVKDPLDAIVGLIAGALVGASLGFGVILWFAVEPFFFVGEAIVVGAIVSAPLGYLYGDDFFRWVRDEWFGPSG